MLLILFELNEELYAIDSKKIIEIIPMMERESVPNLFISCKNSFLWNLVEKREMVVFIPKRVKEPK